MSNDDTNNTSGNTGDAGQNQPSDADTFGAVPPTIPPAATATLPRPEPATAAAPANQANPARRALTVFAIAGIAVVGTILLAIMLIMGLVIGAIAGFAAETDVERISYAPTSVEDIPTSIVSERAEVVIDLSAFDAADFESRTEPLAVDVDVEFGSVEIIVPDGLDVSVDADTDIGSTSVFDRVDDGFDNRVVVDGSENPDVDLVIDLDVGDVDVERN